LIKDKSNPAETLHCVQSDNSDKVFVLEFVEKTAILVMLKAKPEASQPFYMMV
jgi:hypothetical protein